MTATAAHIRQLLISNGFRSGTQLENKVCFRIARAGWSPPDMVQEYRIRKPSDSTHVYRLDFAWPALKICLEVDGWHHRDPNVAAKDMRRDSELRNEGWLTFRVDDVNGEDSLAEQVTRVLQIVAACATDAMHYRRLG